MNTVVQIPFQIMHFSEYMPKSGIAGSYGSSIFSFLRNLPAVLSDYTSLHSTSSVGGLPFLHTCPAFIVCRFFDDGQSDVCEVIPHCIDSFDLHF